MKVFLVVLCLLAFAMIAVMVGYVIYTTQIDIERYYRDDGTKE